MTEIEWIPCCDHCGCTDDRTGHDDTCKFGCNDVGDEESFGDLERKVRAALEVAWRRWIDLGSTGGSSRDYLVPAVVRLIEEERAGLVRAMAVAIEELAKAEAERDELIEAIARGLTAKYAPEAAVAEAEAEIETWKVEASEAAALRAGYLARAERAEAASARVRALCDRKEGLGITCVEVREALDGADLPQDCWPGHDR